MDNRQERTVQSFRNVLAFIDNHPIKPEPPLLGQMRTKLASSVQRISHLSGAQLSAKHDATGRVDFRRRKLRRESMMPLVRIAKPLLAYAPGVEAGLRVPHARADAKTVAAAALRMCDVLKPHTRLLKSAGLSKSFLTDFRAEAQALADAAKTFEKGRQKRSSVTTAMAAEFKKGMQAVTVIEGLVMLHHAKDKGTLAVWRNRRRVTARIGRPKTRRSAAPAAPKLALA